MQGDKDKYIEGCLSWLASLSPQGMAYMYMLEQQIKAEKAYRKKQAEQQDLQEKLFLVRLPWTIQQWSVYEDRVRGIAMRLRVVLQRRQQDVRR